MTMTKMKQQKELHPSLLSLHLNMILMIIRNTSFLKSANQNLLKCSKRSTVLEMGAVKLCVQRYYCYYSYHIYCNKVFDNNIIFMNCCLFIIEQVPIYLQTVKCLLILTSYLYEECTIKGMSKLMLVRILWLRDHFST